MTENDGLHLSAHAGDGSGEGVENRPLSLALRQAEYALNHLRLTYLQAIQGSKVLRSSPGQAVNRRFNGAFCLMSGVGRERSRFNSPSEIHAYLSDMGLEFTVWAGLGWSRGKRSLTQALEVVRSLPDPPGRLLAELYSLKPGFHEAWLHEEYPHDVFEDMDQPLGRILAVNRGLRAELLEPSPEEFRRLTDLNTFLAYAACAITEGPLVRRRQGAGPYAGALRSIGSEPSLTLRQQKLRESFEVLDTWQYLQDHNSEVGLEAFIQAASAFVDSCPGMDS